MKGTFAKAVVIAIILGIGLYFTDKVLYLCFASMPFWYYFYRKEVLRNRSKLGTRKRILLRFQELDEILEKKARFIDAKGRVMKAGEMNQEYKDKYAEIQKEAFNIII